MKIRTVHVTPYQNPKIETITPTVSEYQRLLGGHFELIPPRVMTGIPSDVVAYAYEYGLYECGPCLRFDHQVVHGPILFCATQGPDEITMTDEQITLVAKWIHTRRIR